MQFNTNVSQSWLMQLASEIYNDRLTTAVEKEFATMIIENAGMIQVGVELEQMARQIYLNAHVCEKVKILAKAIILYKQTEN